MNLNRIGTLVAVFVPGYLAAHAFPLFKGVQSLTPQALLSTKNINFFIKEQSLFYVSNPQNKFCKRAYVYSFAVYVIKEIKQSEQYKPLYHVGCISSTQ
ncbi:MAG: hypothetical protein ACOYOS_01905 [Syntrophales bacterium]